MGFCEEYAPLDCMLGMDKGSWGYLGDDRDIFTPDGGGTYGLPYAKKDVVGCGVDFDKEVAFFTMNGIYVGESFPKQKRNPRSTFMEE